MNTEIMSMLAFLAVFAVTGGSGLLIYLWLFRDRRRAISRLRSLGADRPPSDVAANDSSQLLRRVLPSAGKLLLSQEEGRATYWKKRLQQAGYYQSNAMLVLLGVKVLLLFVLPAIGVLVTLALGWGSLSTLMIGLIGAALGLYGPNWWLTWQIGRRQGALRRSLPDALDMLVLCVEGGVSMPAALQRVSEELPAVSELLGQEFGLVQREFQLGMSVGEAFNHFADRCDLEEVRSLAAVLIQAERFGSGVAKSLRLHADAWRLERQQQVEEKAHRAAVLILFPMLLCIFPAIFIVTLGPAAMQMSKLFGGR